MIGNVKNPGTENSLSGMPGRSSHEKPVIQDGTGFLSILKESMDFSENCVIKNDECNASRETGMKLSAPAVADESVAVINTPQTVTGRIETDDRPVHGESLKNLPDPGTENRTEKKIETKTENSQPESRISRTEARKKTDETKESQKEKKSESDAIQHVTGESLLKMLAGKSKDQPAADIRQTGGKLHKAFNDNDDKKRTLTKLPYQGEARQAKIQRESHDISSAGIVGSGVSDMREPAVKEIGRNLQARKKSDEIKILNNAVSRDDVSIPEAVKKEKHKDVRAAAARQGITDEARNDKKQAALPENMQVKQKDAGSEGFTGRNTGGTDQGNRDGNFQNAGRTEMAGKTSMDRTDQVKSMPEFRQSLQEIMDKAKVTVKDGQNGSFSVKLFPKDLGNVNVNLVLENGVVNGRFLVENSEAKNLLLSSLDSLRDELTRSGVNVGEFSVNVRDEGQRFFRDKQEGHGFSPVLNNSRENMTAAVVYDSNSLSYHNGSINMII